MSEEKKVRTNELLRDLLDAIQTVQGRVEALEKRYAALDEHLAMIARITKANAQQIMVLADLAGIAKVKGQDVITDGESRN